MYDLLLHGMMSSLLVLARLRRQCNSILCVVYSIVIYRRADWRLLGAVPARLSISSLSRRVSVSACVDRMCSSRNRTMRPKLFKRYMSNSRCMSPPRCSPPELVAWCLSSPRSIACASVTDGGASEGIRGALASGEVAWTALDIVEIITTAREISAITHKPKEDASRLHVPHQSDWLSLSVH